jgi:uncharacterized protein (DUF362 family)
MCMSEIDRRDFLGTVAAAGAVVALGGQTAQAWGQAAKARVVRCRRKDAVDDADAVNAQVVQQMVNSAVAKLVGAEPGKAAWGKLFGPQDVVTVKVNCLFGPAACTHPEVTDAVVAGLLSAGVPANNITVWDRDEGDLMKCGYEIQKGDGVKCIATQWEAQPTRSGSLNGRLATILTRPENTALVNVPVLKTHSLTGITLALKNHFGSLDNPGAHHGTNADPQLADLNAIPPIREKTRLILADALRPVGDGGPAANAGATWTYGAILAATDPIAMDTVGVKIIDEWRATKGLGSVEPAAKVLKTAAQKGLGVADMAAIELIDI